VDDVEKAVTEVNGKELLGREMRVQKATSGGPYTSENGEHGEATGGESSKPRSKPRPKVIIVVFTRIFTDFFVGNASSDSRKCF
jgi:RNA recognition motif-containing protein